MEQQIATPIEEKKMTANELIVRLAGCINMDNHKGFYDLLERYSNSLPRNGKYTNQIRRLLNQKPQKMMLIEAIDPKIKNLINVVETKLEHVFLNTETQELIDELLIEWENREVFEMHNLGVRSKILLYGASGNGKTTIARHISKLVDLPFIEVNTDALVDSKLGATNSHIHSVFNSIEEPCVLFWDEVDTIGRKRDTRNTGSASTENERMVNSILVNMERLDKNVIFIGATNRYDILDYAFIRRFHVKHEIPNPDADDKMVFYKQMMEYYKMPDIISKDVLDKKENFSAIKDVFLHHARQHIINNIIAK